MENGVVDNIGEGGGQGPEDLGNDFLGPPGDI